jgi:hypothetical protein
MSALGTHQMSSGSLSLEPPLSPPVVRSSGVITPEPSPGPDIASPVPSLRPPESTLAPLAPLAPEIGAMEDAPEPPADVDAPLMSVDLPAMAPDSEPDPEPEPLVALAPVENDLPELEELPEPVPAAPPAAYTVVVRLLDGNGVQVGAFRDFSTAMEGAQEVIAEFANADGSWPFYAGRFIRPDLIVSVDLVAEVSIRPT